MITLKNDTLTLTFPENARKVRLLAERHIEKVASELSVTWDRSALIEKFEAHRMFSKFSPMEQESARTRLRTWTSAQVEGFLREFAINSGELKTDAFADLKIKFQRTMRIPDDGKDYPLPTGLGQLPLYSVDDFPNGVPAAWMSKGGVILPVARNEALCIWFSSNYRFAVQINANADASSFPAPSWSKCHGLLRRYVSSPLGLTEETAAGGIELHIAPMLPDSHYQCEGAYFLPPTIHEFFSRMFFGTLISAILAKKRRRHGLPPIENFGLGVSEKMSSETFQPECFDHPFDPAEWDISQTIRFYLHPCAPPTWRRITGANPLHAPLGCKDYEDSGVPWFAGYQNQKKPLLENSCITPEHIVQCGNTRQPGEIREFLDAS